MGKAESLERSRAAYERKKEERERAVAIQTHASARVAVFEGIPESDKAASGRRVGWNSE